MSKRRRGNRGSGKELVVAQQKAPQSLSSVDDSRGWMTLWGGAGYSNWQLTQGFQLDIDTRPQRLQSNWVVFACQTLIAGDLGKLRVALGEQKGGVWLEAESAPYDRLLRKPNGFQLWQQFVEYWSLSKQRGGNTYVLKERDLTTKVRALYVLDPDYVTPLIAPDGSVYYRLQADDLADVPDGDVVVPASEIMHDRFNCMFHPLVGISPLFASALGAIGGLTMLEDQQRFFRNGARPGGLLTTPGVLQQTDMKRYKEEWETNFGGANSGRTAVLGNGLKYEAIRTDAVDSELIAQLKLSAEMICATHHVPAYKIGVGAMPTYQNAEVLNQIYYDDCLQKLIEAIEGQLDDGLELFNVDGRNLRAQFDLDGLLRMDSATQVESLNKAVGGGWMAPNEARARRGLEPVKGGESPRMQQQVFSLEALDERDRNDPFAKPAAPTPPANPDAEAAKAAAANVLRAKRFEDSLIAKIPEAA